MDMEKVVRSVFFPLLPSPCFYFVMVISGPNSIDFGKHVVLRRGVPVIAETRKR